MIAGKIVAAEEIIELIHCAYFRLQLRISSKYPALKPRRSAKDAFVQQRPQHKNSGRPLSFVGSLYPRCKLLSIANKKHAFYSLAVQIADNVFTRRCRKTKLLRLLDAQLFPCRL